MASTVKTSPPQASDAIERRLRLRIDLGYDGGEFAGWAIQPGQRTVQGEVERALDTALRIAGSRTVVAGRTDAGVHARAQVVHVDVPEVAWKAVRGHTGRPREQVLASRLRGLLPTDVVIHSVAPAPSGFDARFSALRRRYRYLLADEVTRWDPCRRGIVARTRGTLDLIAMNAAALALLGEHDFRPFCRPRAGATTVRTLLELACSRSANGEIVAWVGADAFCHNMVRTLIGALVCVGQGRWDIERPASVLASGVKDSAATVMPACGLTLMEVDYPVDAEVAARAAIARARRDEPQT